MKYIYIYIYISVEKDREFADEILMIFEKELNAFVI